MEINTIIVNASKSSWKMSIPFFSQDWLLQLSKQSKYQNEYYHTKNDLVCF